MEQAAAVSFFVYGEPEWLHEIRVAALHLNSTPKKGTER